MNSETPTGIVHRGMFASVFERRDVQAHLVVCAVVVAITAAILMPLMTRGWIPHDEGTLAQSAHRVLMGELPHRDFDDLYTGGLALIHAGAFRLLGERLASLRVVLFFFILVSIPAFYYIASRFASAVPAGIAIIAIVGWSFTNYAASMPSWFNLLFAAVGCAALMRWRETGRSRWLFLGGACGGLSIAVKIVGLYFVAAALLFLAFHATSSSDETTKTPAVGDRLPRLILVVGLVLASALPFALMRAAATPSQLINLAVPATLTGLFVSACVMRAGDLRRIAQMLKNAAVLLAGVAAPLVLFVIPYVKTGSLGSLYEGVFVLPQKRLTWGASGSGGPPNWGVFLPLLWLTLMLLPRCADDRLSKFAIGAWGMLCGAIVLAAANSLLANKLVWLSVAMAALPIVTVGIGLIGRAQWSKTRNQTTSLKHEHLFLLLATTAWCGLVQFPFTAPIYFCFIAPFLILSAFAIGSTFAPRSLRMGMTILATYSVLGLLLRNNFFSATSLERVVMRGDKTAFLDMPRGGLTVQQEDRALYSAVADTISAHTHSNFIYVTPDAPEVYFLAGKENPTRTLFDYFDDPVGRDERILHALSAHDVHLVVMNSEAGFSGPVPTALRDSLVARFPVGVRIGQFVIRWEAPRVANAAPATIADVRRR